MGEAEIIDLPRRGIGGVSLDRVLYLRELRCPQSDTRGDGSVVSKLTNYKVGNDIGQAGGDINGR